MTAINIRTDDKLKARNCKKLKRLKHPTSD